MGNAQGNLDKRTYRKENASIFQQIIDHFETPRGLNVPCNDVVAPCPNPSQNGINVVVRLRPMFKHELAKGEFQVVRCDPRGSGIVVHKCMPSADLKPITSFVEHFMFPIPEGHVFSEKNTTEQLYERIVHPMVTFVLQDAADAAVVAAATASTAPRNARGSSKAASSPQVEERRGTIFMYGQTGTGKTYTITGIIQQLAKDIFSYLEMLDSEMSNWNIGVQCLELLNDAVYDLNNNHAEIRLMQTADVHVVGAIQKTIENHNALWQSYKTAAALRETHATAINSQSSRSHFLFRINIEYAGAKFARLSLIDLAGSERNADSLYHDVERQRESAWINASLAALKDIFRMACTGQSLQSMPHIFRANKLTQLLRDSFIDGHCKTVLISTISPIATDTEHTINTLQHMSLLAASSAGNTENIPVLRTTAKEVAEALKAIKDAEEPRLKPLNKWTAEEVQEWLLNADGGRYAKYINNFPYTLTGAQVMRYTEQRFTQATGDPRVGAALRKSLDDYLERCSRQKTEAAAEQRERQRIGARSLV